LLAGTPGELLLVFIQSRPERGADFFQRPHHRLYTSPDFFEIRLDLLPLNVVFLARELGLFAQLRDVLLLLCDMLSKGGKHLLVIH
jgi:hypothetical protein